MNAGKILFLGSKRAGLNALTYLLHKLPPGSISAIVCPDDRTDIRTEYESFRLISHQYEVDLYLVKGNKETEEIIEKYDPQTILVHGWYFIIPVEMFPRVDFLGFHYSPLPKYRGNAPLVWQIINGEKKLGVSFFVLSKGMDEGDLIDQRFFDLEEQETISDALQKANQIVLSILDDFVPHLLSGNWIRRPQMKIPASYCGLRMPEDGRIDWKAEALTVHNFIRAQTDPYPGAFSYINDNQLVRFWSSAIESRTFYGVPGAVIDIKPDGIVVACGSGALKVQAEVESEKHSAPDFRIRSLKVRFR